MAETAGEGQRRSEDHGEVAREAPVLLRKVEGEIAPERAWGSGRGQVKARLRRRARASMAGAGCGASQGES
jgi:hypothetical protein